MKSFQEFLLEKLITFGGKAYPKFGNVVILAGGAGSGKGFTISNLLGIEGKTIDVDALKVLAQKTPAIVQAIKDKFGKDISQLDMKNSDNTFALHTLLADKLKLTDKSQELTFKSILSAPKDRMPNLIFDVTLKDIKKFYDICRNVEELGYAKENVHIVWVLNDFEIAAQQNAKRSRVVPEEILKMTHVGAAMTMKDILEMSDTLPKYMDGDIWISFNKANVDTELVKSGSFPQWSGTAGYVKGSNYIKVKAKGKKPIAPSELGQEIIDKIAEYTPSKESWKDLSNKKEAE